ncbi:MAG: pyruvate dehydrogenase (acetyl-transferring), homodimeric type, partial [Candidatus Latescibacterota bacterium]
VFYYLTVTNEPYLQPAMVAGAEDGIIKGIYRCKESDNKAAALRVNLFGSGAILNKVIEAQSILDERYGVAADVWSVTSYKELHRDGLMADRWNMIHPQETAKVPYLAQALEGRDGVFVAASDYVKALPESVSKWIPGRLISLGTDGFGRSDGRAHLRDFFEVDERYVTLAALHGLAADGRMDGAVVGKAIRELDIDPGKVNPMTG